MEKKKSEQGWHDEKVRAAGVEFFVVKGGDAGGPILVLHDEIGHPGWLKWHSSLSLDHRLIIPGHPGFGRTPRLEWILDMRDLASAYSRFVREQTLAPVDVVGFSLGGWLAAEMAAADPKIFRKMVLVSPTGIRPTKGEILDLYNYTVRNYLKAGVSDWENNPEFSTLFGGPEDTLEILELWEDARCETSRIAWKPYMFSDSLPQRLAAVTGLPTLLVWGDKDKVVPLSAGEAYNAAIPGSKLVVLKGIGHHPEIECPEEFLEHLHNFFA
jgi:pimeloyl-ACP methyl ester carboxylesterase